ncbi:MAG: ATP-binding protein [Patescibacteria group bacterium]|nr:ATP-binding protein [Patescibacteria group bacterium]
MKIAYIMRGVPGSGKSTVAKRIADSGGVIHSTDSYFYKDGRYQFDLSLLGEYHQKNLQVFSESVCKGVPVVVCDNTNVKREHWEPYAQVARNAGYIVAVVSLPHPEPSAAAERNTHQVPEHIIRRMIELWEP